MDILYRPGNPLSLSEPPVAEFAPGTRLLPAGSVHADGAMPLPVDIEVFEDVAIPMRDDVVLYGDVYRRAGAGPVPAVLIYTIYSKRGGYWNAKVDATKFGVPSGHLSGLQPFEALDPAYWCAHEYAIVVVDARGTGHSEGDFMFVGSATGRDVADTVEWIAEQPWSTGKVGMAGNSYLAMAQWPAAAERPQHLSAIAPWEGLTDVFRDVLLRGGIPDVAFTDDDIMGHLYGNARFEHLTATLLNDPHEGPYWADKRADLSEVEIPAYVVSSWSNSLHARSTQKAFERLASDRKWLRLHNTHEWVDIADPERVADLRRFFDRYLKDIPNDWESTPRVRYSVLDLGGTDEVDRPAETWPPVPVTPTALHLDAASSSLSETTPGEASAASYETRGATPYARFEYAIERETLLLGPLAARLWVETSEGDDLDLFASVFVLDAAGDLLYHVAYPGLREGIDARAREGRLTASDVYLGPTGRLRASRRALDPNQSSVLAPHLAHDRDEPVTPGVPVQVDLGIWPTGMHLHRGQRLVFEIASRPFGPLPPSPTVTGLPPAELPTRNQGRHTIHTGADLDSVLFVPIAQVGPAPGSRAR